MLLLLAGYSGANVTIVSNLYAVPYLSRKWKVVYDMNDHHLAFENTPPWLAGHFRKLCRVASVIVISCRALEELCGEYRNKVRYIGNGVDTSIVVPQESGLKEKQVIFYGGAISEIVDFDLLAKILCETGEGRELVMVGPIFPSVKGRMDALLANHPERIRWIPAQPQPVLQEHISRADVCLIPFVRSPLTRYANPNKAYEYLAHGKPVVATNASASLEEMKDYLFIAKDSSDFVRMSLADYSREDESVRQARRKYAQDNDWRIKAREYTDLLTGLSNR
jgi:glycosyltransferase involved in cell wall biosynthesis